VGGVASNRRGQPDLGVHRTPRHRHGRRTAGGHLGRVSIFGFGFAPGSPVTTKWNNAFGFPDNGVGANSVKLQSPIPDANGRFAFQTIHRGVLRAAADWLWQPNQQLVIVAQQGVPGSPSWREAAQRYIPGHVLWQWIPHWPVVSASP